MENNSKRYCKTLQLKNDPELIAEYKSYHGNGGAWPEIAEGMKKVGIIDMERIYKMDQEKECSAIDGQDERIRTKGENRV